MISHDKQKGNHAILVLGENNSTMGDTQKNYICDILLCQPVCFPFHLPATTHYSPKHLLQRVSQTSRADFGSTLRTAGRRDEERLPDPRWGWMSLNMILYSKNN